MQLEDYFDFSAQPYAIRIKGQRIGLEQVVERWQEGKSAEQIIDELPGLTLEQVHATLTYYFHNKSELDAYMSAINQNAEQLMRQADANPTAASVRMRALFKERYQKQVV